MNIATRHHAQDGLFKRIIWGLALGLSFLLNPALLWATDTFNANDALLSEPDTLIEAPIAPPGLRAKVTALDQTILSSQLAGRIEELLVRDGDRFEKGQILAKIDCVIPQAQLKSAEANAKKQRAVYETTKRLEKLNSRSPLELAITEAEKEQAEAELAIAQNMVSRCQIAAPFSGAVSNKMVQDKQFVNEGQPLFEILNQESLELEFIAPSNWLSWFTPGYKFTVHIDETQKSYEAVLTRVSAQVDAVSQSIKVYAEIKKPDQLLLPGMSGEAIITPPEKLMTRPENLEPLPTQDSNNNDSKS